MHDQPFADFTTAAHTALQHATRIASLDGSPTVTPLHLLLGLLEGSTNRAQILLQRTGVNVAVLRAQLRAMPSTPTSSASAVNPPLSPSAQQVLADASKEARLLGHGQVDALHILSGLLYDPIEPAARALNTAGATLFDLRTAVKQQKLVIRKVIRFPSVRNVIRPSAVFVGVCVLMFATGGALWYGVPDRLVQLCMLLFIISGWVASLCLHEFGHALAAYLGGDTSVVEKGYLTLNPLRYTHPFLSIILPLILVLAGGLGLPGGAVYIQDKALRSRAWESIVSAAGPLGTIIFTLFIGWPFLFDWYAWVTDANYVFWYALAFLALLQISALVFNLLPIPSLDGFGILSPLLSAETRLRFQMAGGVFMLLLFMILATPSPISAALWMTIFNVADAVGIPVDIAWYGRQILYEGLAAIRD